MINPLSYSTFGSPHFETIETLTDLKNWFFSERHVDPKGFTSLKLNAFPPLSPEGIERYNAVLNTPFNVVNRKGKLLGQAKLGSFIDKIKAKNPAIVRYLVGSLVFYVYGKEGIRDIFKIWGLNLSTKVLDEIGSLFSGYNDVDYKLDYAELALKTLQKFCDEMVSILEAEFPSESAFDIFNDGFRDKLYVAEPNPLYVISVGSRSFSVDFFAYKSIQRKHLFYKDALWMNHETLEILSDLPQELWGQVILDKLFGFIHTEKPEEIDKHGWTCLQSDLLKNGTFFDETLELELEKGVLKNGNLFELLKDVHAKHLKCPFWHLLLQASLYLSKSKKITPEGIKELWIKGGKEAPDPFITAFLTNNIPLHDLGALAIVLEKIGCPRGETAASYLDKLAASPHFEELNKLSEGKLPPLPKDRKKLGAWKRGLATGLMKKTGYDAILLDPLYVLTLHEEHPISPFLIPLLIQELFKRGYYQEALKASEQLQAPDRQKFILNDLLPLTQDVLTLYTTYKAITPEIPLETLKKFFNKLSDYEFMTVREDFIPFYDTDPEIKERFDKEMDRQYQSKKKLSSLDSGIPQQGLIRKLFAKVTGKDWTSLLRQIGDLRPFNEELKQLFAKLLELTPLSQGLNQARLFLNDPKVKVALGDSYESLFDLLLEKAQNEDLDKSFACEMLDFVLTHFPHKSYPLLEKFRFLDLPGKIRKLLESSKKELLEASPAQWVSLLSGFKIAPPDGFCLPIEPATASIAFLKEGWYGHKPLNSEEAFIFLNLSLSSNDPAQDLAFLENRIVPNFNIDPILAVLKERKLGACLVRLTLLFRDFTDVDKIIDDLSENPFEKLSLLPYAKDLSKWEAFADTLSETSDKKVKELYTASLFNPAIFKGKLNATLVRKALLLMSEKLLQLNENEIIKELQDSSIIPSFVRAFIKLRAPYERIEPLYARCLTPTQEERIAWIEFCIQSSQITTAVKTFFKLQDPSKYSLDKLSKILKAEKLNEKTKKELIALIFPIADLKPLGKDILIELIKLLVEDPCLKNCSKAFEIYKTLTVPISEHLFTNLLKALSFHIEFFDFVFDHFEELSYKDKSTENVIVLNLFDHTFNFYSLDSKFPDFTSRMNYIFLKITAQSVKRYPHPNYSLDHIEKMKQCLKERLIRHPSFMSLVPIHHNPPKPEKQLLLSYPITFLNKIVTTKWGLESLCYMAAVSYSLVLLMLDHFEDIPFEFDEVVEKYVDFIPPSEEPIFTGHEFNAYTLFNKALLVGYFKRYPQRIFDWKYGCKLPLFQANTALDPITPEDERFIKIVETLNLNNTQQLEYFHIRYDKLLSLNTPISIYRAANLFGHYLIQNKINSPKDIERLYKPLFKLLRGNLAYKLDEHPILFIYLQNVISLFASLITFPDYVHLCSEMSLGFALLVMEEAKLNGVLTNQMLSLNLNFLRKLLDRGIFKDKYLHFALVVDKLIPYVDSPEIIYHSDLNYYRDLFDLLILPIKLVQSEEKAIRRKMLSGWVNGIILLFKAEGLLLARELWRFSGNNIIEVYQDNIYEYASIKKTLCLEELGCKLLSL